MLLAITRWLVTSGVAFFAVLLWDRFLAEPSDYPKPPVYSPPALVAIDTQMQKVEAQIVLHAKMFSLASRQKELAQEAFDNWLRAQRNIRSPGTDKELDQRMQQVQNAHAILLSWENRRRLLEAQRESLHAQLNHVHKTHQRLYEKALQAYQEQKALYDLRIFLLRLLITFPLLGLGIFWAVRKRQSPYWPLYRGILWAGVIVFFWKLYPYLPDYGYYVRYGVGLGLAVGGGYYVLREIQRYLQARQSLQKETATHKLKRLELDKVIDYYRQQMCPSCERKLALKPWEAPLLADAPLQNMPMYCRYCGTALYTKCKACGKVTPALFPYCMHCGVSIEMIDPHNAHKGFAIRD
ncbi:MAG: hypothetical protein ACUVRD_05465 [Bacteroidia bacterium]